MCHLYAHKYVMHVEYITCIYCFINIHIWTNVIYGSISNTPIYICIKYIYLKDQAKNLMSAGKKRLVKLEKVLVLWKKVKLQFTAFYVMLYKLPDTRDCISGPE